MTSTRIPLAILLILLLPSCVSEEAFRRRMDALIQARDRAGGAHLDDIRFSPGALEATEVAEMDTVMEDGLRRTILARKRVRYRIDTETGAISLEEA
jgi:hypothetical protein